MDEVAAEGAPGGRLEQVAELVAEAPPVERVRVGVEGLVEAAAHGPEEPSAHVEAAQRRVPEMRKEEAGGALVLVDGVHEVRDVEGRDVLDAEEHVVGRDVIVHLQRGRAGAEAPARVGLRAGREAAALHLVDVGRDPLDAAGLDEQARLHVPDGVLEGALPLVEVHHQLVAGQALVAAQEDDVAGGLDALRLRPVLAQRGVDVDLLGLDPRVPVLEVDEAGRAIVRGVDLLLLVGRDGRAVGLGRVAGRLGRRGLEGGRRGGGRRRAGGRAGRRRSLGGGEGGDRAAEEGDGPGQSHAWLPNGGRLPRER